jgi:hypothetical protein
MTGTMPLKIRGGVVPKITDYPRASLRRVLVLAAAVDRLGGEASIQSAAEAIGQKIGGAFKSLVGAAVKFQLLSNVRGRLKTTKLFEDYKLGYNEEHKTEALRIALMNMPLFREIATRLNNQPVPSHLDKLMIREYGVPQEVASRVVQYFVEGAREVGVLNSVNGLITANPLKVSTDTRIVPGTGSVLFGLDPTAPSADNADLEMPDEPVFGPGIDTRISIKDEEDLEIVEVTLRKVRRLLKVDQEKGSDS